RIEVAGNVNRAADAVAVDIVTVLLARNDAIAAGTTGIGIRGTIVIFVKPIVGVHPVVAIIRPTAAMELLRAALGDDRDCTARVAAIFGLIVGAEDLDFLNRVHIGLVVKRAVRTR